jgi:hypothetical protein
MNEQIKSLTEDEAYLADAIQGILRAHGYNVPQLYCRLTIAEMRPYFVGEKEVKNTSWNNYPKKMLEANALGIALGVVEE